MTPRKKVAKYKTGDLVEIVDKSGHCFPVGRRCILGRRDDMCFDATLQGSTEGIRGGARSQWLTPTNMRKVNKARGARARRKRNDD